MIKLENQTFYSVNHVKITLNNLMKRKQSNESRLRLSSYEERLMYKCQEYINKYGA